MTTFEKVVFFMFAIPVAAIFLAMTVHMVWMVFKDIKEGE